MATLPPAVIGDAYGSDTAWNTLEALTAIGNRMSGQDGERDAARVIETAFDDVGLRAVQTSDFEIPGWWRGAASLAVDEPRPRTFDGDHEIIGLPGSPSADVIGSIVDVGHGLPEDFEGIDAEGDVVLVSSDVPPEYGRWVHRQEKYARAVEAGADGFLFHSRTSGGLPPTGFISFSGAAASIPGAGLSKEAGDRLQRYAAQGVTARLSIDARTGETTSRNVEATVGPDTDAEVVVGAHLDAHDIGEGAGDDGSGCAILTEVGRLLARAEDRLETGVRLIGFGAEEAGMYGSERWAAAHDRSSIRCMLNLDGIGDSRTIRLYPHGFDGIEAAFDDALAELGLSYNTEPGVFAHGDQWPFVRRGVPAAMVGSGGGGRVAHAHTHIDTIDKIDRRDLRDLAIAVAGGVVKLAESGRSMEAVPPSVVRDRIDRETRTTLEQQGRWEWDDR